MKANLEISGKKLEIMSERKIEVALDDFVLKGRRQTETVKNEGSKLSFNERPIIDRPLTPEELADMDVEDLMKANLEISGKKLEIMSERQIEVALDDFVLKEQMQTINENIEEVLRRQHKRQIKRKRGEDKGEQEVGPTFMIATVAAVQEVRVVDGGRARERDKS